MQPSDAHNLLAQRLRRAAILTIDAQKTFVAKDGGLARIGFDIAPLRAVLPNIANLHQHARRAKIPLIHVRTIGGPGLNWSHEVLAPAWLKRLEMAPPGTTLCSPGSPLIEFADEARPQEGELVITKHTHDAFNGTPLSFALKGMNVQTVVLAGFTTEGCIETTARSAYCNGYAVVVVEDAVASPDQELHNASLRLVAKHLGIVTTVEEIMTTANSAGFLGL